MVGWKDIKIYEKIYEWLNGQENNYEKNRWIKNRWMDKNGRLDGYNTWMVGWIKKWMDRKKIDDGWKDIKNKQMYR